MGRRLLVLAGLIVLFTGCFDQKAWLNKFIPEADDKLARRFIDSVRRGDLNTAVAMLDGTSLETDARRGLEQLRGYFNQSAFVEAETIGFNVQKNLGNGQRSRISRLEYQIQLEKHWIVGFVTLVGEGDALRINSARFDNLPNSLGVLNAFTLQGKGLLHYLVLTLMVSIPVFCIAVVTICARSKLRRKWLWILFILLPLGTLRLNWSTGGWDTQLLSFNLLGVSFMKLGLYAPWIMSVGCPVGAVVFLVRRKQLTTPPAGAIPPPVTQ